MLSLTWLIVTGLIAWAHAQDYPLDCPEICECSEQSDHAKCSTLSKEQFPERILHLTIQPHLSIETKDSIPLIIEDNAFANIGLRFLNTLVIKHTSIKSISPNAFKGLDHLRSVVLENCYITDIPRDLFKHLPLEQLSLANNPLEKIEFSTRMQLEELNLANCDIELTNNTFKNVSKLEYLNLASNKISKVEPSYFSYLEDLYTLDLSNNEISEVPPNLLENIEDLSTLNMSNNPITTFYLKNQGPSDELILKSCDINRIESRFGDFLINLSNLDLSDNDIEFIETGAFSKLEDLEYLDLSGNSLSSLEADIFAHNTKLEKIVLNDNIDLQTLPVFQTTETFVTYIFQCNSCGLRELDNDTFSAMPAIATLHLANNMLREVNGAVFRTLTGLSNLDLSNNQLTHIDVNTFAKNPNLMKLNLASNPLKVIATNIFRSNPALNTLDVSSCKLSVLWDRSVIDPVPSLETLKAANNNITIITETDLSLTSNLKALDISKNKLMCNEEFTDLINWLIQHSVSPRFSSKEELTKQGFDFEIMDTRNEGWKQVGKTLCPNTFDDSTYYSDENDMYDAKIDNTIGPDEAEDEDDMYDTDGEIDDDIDANILSEIRSPRKTMYSYMWPTLVFIFTALLVLVIVANFIMLLLKHRGTIDVPNNILPHIKIQPWGTGNKLKKHSGSVYRPLSEDISGPRTPMINRYAQIPSPAVHSPATV